MSTHITTGSVIDALGGNAAVAKLCGRDSKTVSNWRHQRPDFPSSTYLIFQAALAEKGLSAPPELWGMDTSPAATPAEAS